MMRGIIILLVCLFCETFITKAQLYPYRYYNTANGLIQSQVTSLTQDKTGFIWIGTIGGLNKFDGKKFTKYTTRNGLSEDWVTALNTDPNGNIWIGHWSGNISLYENNFQYLKTIKTTKQIKLNAIDKIKNNPFNGGVWVSNKSNTLFYYHHYDSLPQKITLTIPNQTLFINDFVIKDSLVIAATNKGLYYINARTKNVIYSDFLQTSFLNVVLLKNRLYCLTDDFRFLMINLFTGQFIELMVAEPYRTIVKDSKNLIALSNNELWLTTKNSGACKINVGTNNVITLIQHNFEHGLAYNETNALLCDIENSIWIGTNAGLNQYLGDGFLMLNKWSGLPDNMIKSVCVFNKIIYALSPFGISVIEQSTLKPLYNISHKNLNSICLYKNQPIVSDNNTVYNLTNQTLNKIISVSDSINVIESNENGIYIATRKGLYQYADNKLTKILEGEFYRLAVSKNGLFALNLSNELFLINNKSINKVEIDVLENELVLAIKEDMNQNVWFSTYHSGIICLNKNGKTYHYPLVDNDYHYIPFSIAIDNKYIWAGTNRGIVRINLNDKQFIVFNSFDGFEGVEVNINAFVISDNMLYIGTIMGLCVFNTNYANRLEVLPKPFIKAITTFPDHLEVNSTDRIPANNNNIKIEFTGLSTLWANKTIYRYRLLGLDSNWIITQNEEIWFRRLKPGTYFFELQTQVGNYVNTSETARIKFYIKPPFYKTSWFMATCFIVTVLILYFLFKNKTRNLYLDKLELESQLLDLQKQLEECKAETKKITQTDKNL